MSKEMTVVEYDRVKFDIMADGRVLVTVMYPGEMAMLERSVIIQHFSPDDTYRGNTANYDLLIELFTKAKDISEATNE